MNHATHHIPARLIRAYAAGSLPQAYALVVAAHVSMCDACRADLAAEETAGGAVLEGLVPAATGGEAGLRDAVLAALDAPPPPPEPAETATGAGIYPAPIMAALKGRPPRWRPVGRGIRQSIVAADGEGVARLLWIPPATPVPDHSHGGLELTLVLQGSFHDETGEFGVGDVEVADDALEHTPIAGGGAPCICLAATDAPLRFRSLVPRLLQPLLRI